MLTLNPVGGLANRMRAIASGITYARATCCPLMVVWCCNWEIKARFSDIFEMPPELRGRIFYVSPARYAVHYEIPRLRNCYVTRLTCRRFTQTVNDTLPTLPHGALLRACNAFYPFEADLYRSLFRPLPHLRKRIDAIVAQLGQHSVGVHIRRTDNAESIKWSTDTLFEEAMAQCLDEQPDTRFYLATDSEDVKRRFAARFGNHVLFNPAPARRNTLRGIEDAVVELFVLASTQRILGSHYSSFSEAASLLGPTPLLQLKQR